MRILLKLSGAVLSGTDDFGVNKKRIDEVCQEIKTLQAKGHQIAIVVGGGNIWRGRDTEASGINHNDRHVLGMMATVFNGVALRSVLQAIELETSIYSAIDAPGELVMSWHRESALEDLDAGTIVVCVGGTGNPYFTTDSGAALRSIQLECDVILKATNVDGVYDKDPNKHDDATLYKELSFDEVISQNLNVMDQTAFALCKDNNMNIRVFNIDTPGNLASALDSSDLGTLIS